MNCCIRPSNIIKPAKVLLQSACTYSCCITCITEILLILTLSNQYTHTHTRKYKYLHSHGIHLQWSIRKMSQIFSNECQWSCDGKIDIDFFGFRGYLSLSHKYKDWSTLFLFALGNLTMHVNLWEALPVHKINMWLGPFISQCKQKSVLQSLNEINSNIHLAKTLARVRYLFVCSLEL